MGRLVKGYELDVGEYTGRMPVASTSTRPPKPEDGQVLFNSTSNTIEVFRNGNWEQAAVVGNTTIAKDSFMGDGVSTTFSPLSYYYYQFDAKQVLVFVENVYQEPDVAYTLHENEIIFAEPIPSGLNIIILHGYATIGAGFNTAQLQTFYAPLLTTLVPEISSGSPMYTRANTATFVDHEGWVRQVATNEARFEGMRRVQNLLTDSEDFNDVSWVKTNSGTGSVPILTSGFTDPDSGSTAWRLQLDKGAGGTSGDLSTLIGSVTSVAGRDYTRSVWMRSNTGGSQIVRLRESNASTIDVEVTTTWQRFSATATNVATSSTVETSLEILTRGDLVTTQSVDILIWHPQVEEVTGQVNQAPADYVSSQVLSWPYHGAGVDSVKYFDTDNGNFVSNVYVTEQVGNAISSSVFQGMKFEKPNENLITYSKIYDDVSWTPTNANVTANITTAPDGTGEAYLLNEDNTAAIAHYILHSSISISNGSAYTYSIFAKNAGRNYVSIQADAGSGYLGAPTGFDLVTGTVTALGAGTDAAGVEVYKDGWYRLWLTSTATGTSASTSLALRQTTGAGFEAYNGDGSSGVYLWGSQLEAGSVLTTYIPTLNITVQRGGDQYYLTRTDNIYSDQGTAYAEFVYAHSGIEFKNARIIGDLTDSSAALTLGGNTVPVQSYDGSNATTTPVVDAIPTGVMIRGAATWNDSIDVLKTATQSTVGTAVTYDGSIIPNFLSIGSGNGASDQFTGTIRNVRIWRKYLTDDKLTLIVGA